MKPAVSQNKYAINSDGPLGTPRLRWRSTRYQATNGNKMSVPQYIQWGSTKWRLGIFPRYAFVSILKGVRGDAKRHPLRVYHQPSCWIRGRWQDLCTSLDRRIRMLVIALPQAEP